MLLVLINMVTIADLKAMAVVSDLSDGKLAKLAWLAKEVAFNEEDVIFSKNLAGNALFFKSRVRFC